MQTKRQYNLQNLRPFTSEEARASQAKALIARKEKRERSEAIVKAAAAISDAPVSDDELKEKLLRLGVEDEELRNSALIAAAVFRRAVRGNLCAVEKWEEWLDRSAGGQGQGAEEGAGDGDAALALSLMRANYLENIDSSFGAISVCALKHRFTHFEASGGRGSGKSSWASLTVVRLVMEHPDVHALVLRKVANTLRDSVFAQYQWAIEQLGVSACWASKRSPPELVYLPTGQRILFRGADDPMKIKSIKTKFGYIGITHFEEKDQFAGRTEIDSILQSTMRGGELFWNFETYNPPRSRDNWANKDSLVPRENRMQHKSSYLDLDRPEWLGEAFFEEAENLRLHDEKRYRHEYLGEAVGVGGNVFENLELREIREEEIRRFDHIYQGVDWGWFPNPYAFIRLHYDRDSETVFLLDEHVGNKMTNEQTARWILAQGYGGVPVICDSAEKKSVADYRSLGLSAREAVKGPGSVEYGMKWLQRRRIVIDRRRTPHAYEEFVGYEYEKNKADEWISGYPDRNNHSIDAVRYALERVMNNYRSNA